MKALVYTEYGSPDVLQFKDIEKPTPKDDEVLVKIHAVALNALDWRLMAADPFPMRLMGGLLKPKIAILGSDIAGTVEAVGKNVTEFQPGDAVIGGLSENGWGGLAEYVTAPEAALVAKPANSTFEEAATLAIAGVAALQGLRDCGEIKAGDNVLINGASGGVGTFAVQIAKAFGAEVTAVCSTAKLDMARSLGADHVIDYTKENFTQNGKQYDLILAANGYHPLAEYKRALTLEGRYVCVGGMRPQVFQSMLLGPIATIGSGKKIIHHAVKVTRKDLAFLAKLLEVGKLTPVIDQHYPLSEGAEAFRHIQAGHVRGKLVITV